MKISFLHLTELLVNLFSLSSPVLISYSFVNNDRTKLNSITKVSKPYFQQGKSKPYCRFIIALQELVLHLYPAMTRNEVYA